MKWSSTLYFISYSNLLIYVCQIKIRKLTLNLIFPSLIGNRIHLQEQKVKHLTDGRKVNIWMPTNWTTRLT